MEVQSNNNKHSLTYFLIFIIVSLSIYLVYFSSTDGAKCMASPLTYGVDKLNTPGHEVTCSCSMRGNLNQLLYFNSTKMTIVDSVPLIFENLSINSTN